MPRKIILPNFSLNKSKENDIRNIGLDHTYYRRKGARILKTSIEHMQEAAPWSDGGGGCRNQRAPRIGDIQRHKAVEMERTTSASTNSSTTSSNSINTSKTATTPTTTPSPTTATSTKNPFTSCSSCTTSNKFEASSTNPFTMENESAQLNVQSQEIQAIHQHAMESREFENVAIGGDESLSINLEKLQLTEENLKIITDIKTGDDATSDTSSSSRCKISENLEGSVNDQESFDYISTKNHHYPILTITSSTTNTYTHMISKCLSQSSSTTTITSSSSPTSSIIIDSPSITMPPGPSIQSLSSSQPPCSPQPTPQSFIRLLPKTQSLDLADNDDIDADVDEDEELRARRREVPIGGLIRQNVDRHNDREDIMIRRRMMLQSQSQFEIKPPSHLTMGMIPKIQSVESRPIYPNVPYSPYGSPYGSPRSNRRRTPLRESRRVSIEQSGSFLQLNQYKLLDKIGQGSYGLVKLAYSEEDSTHYAMKILSKRKLLRKAGLIGRGPKKTTSPLDRVYREIAVLKKLDHPNVVKLIEVLDDPLEDSLYLVFELVTQGEVLNIPTDRPLNEERAWCVFRDALQGLEYLHYQRIIHADIKPGNLLLGECGQVKIADLGVCNEFLGEDATMNNGSTAGTPAFRAPETLIPGQHLYSGKAADIWALGATLYTLVYGKVPFVATSVPAVYEKIKNDQLNFPDCPAISADLRDLIEKILKKDPSKRITLPHIKEHPWVTANKVCPLPSEEENCRLVQISEEDINTVVKSIPKLDTLILIKTMLKNHSFQNPFTKGISGRAPQRGGSRLERFTRAGRSNSAPGAYHLSDRQLSNENLLPAVSEGTPGSCNESSDQSFDG